MPELFVDTETTSVDPVLRRPWEIGLIRRPALDDLERITVFVGDVDLSHADKHSLDIGRFYQRHPLYSDVPEHREIKSWWAATPEVLWLGTDTVLAPERYAASVVERWARGAQIIGLAPDFDTTTLDPMLRRHGLLPRWHHHTLNIQTEAAGWLKGRLHASDPALLHCAEKVRVTVQFPRDNAALSMLCGVHLPAQDARHTAMGDALWVQRWWDQITPASHTVEISSA